MSKGWDTALEVAEAERRLNIEGITDARIVSDERIAITSTILLPKVRTKVRVAFEILAAVGAEDDELSTTVSVAVKVVYGEAYNEKKMSEFVEKAISGFEGWDGAVRALREKLIARGPKGGKT